MLARRRCQMHPGNYDQSCQLVHQETVSGWGGYVLSSRYQFFWMDAAVKRRAERKGRARTDKKMATTKSLYAMLSPFKRSGTTPGGGGCGDATTKPASDQSIVYWGDSACRKEKSQRKGNQLQRGTQRMTIRGTGAS
jgi:hypothetical protein